MNKITIWSCDLSQQNGQNIVTREVCELLEPLRPKYLFYKSGSLRGVINIINNLCVLLTLNFKSKNNIVYVVASRSKLGFLRDIPAYICSLLGMKIVIHFHGSDVIKLINSFLFGKLALFFFKRAMVIVPSSHLIEPLLAHQISNLCVIENFCNFSKITSEKSAVHDNDKSFIIFWNSNIIHSKGVFLLAEAVLKLNLEGFAIKLILSGLPIGDELLNSQSTIEKLNDYACHSCIDYIGRINHETMKILLNRANLVCLPSWYKSECQPLSIIEAMCFGKRIIISNTSAMLATVNDYPSLIISAFSSDALKHQIMKVFNDEEIISMQPHADKARERFSKELFHERILTVFNNLMSEII